MPTHSGHEGIVKIGANTVAEVTSWSIEESAETIDDTALSDTAKTFIAGQTSWTASIECHWDETDTTGQGAMTAGSTVTLNLYPEGDASGDTFFTGSAIITSISRAGGGGSTVTASFSAQGNGALTSSTVV